MQEIFTKQAKTYLYIKTSAKIISVEDFDKWNKQKKKVSKKDVDSENLFFNEREIWWCSLGKNIGLEQNGKGELFERPVLITKKFNKHIFLGVPLTSKEKDLSLPFYLKLVWKENTSTIIISQIRILSSKRLIRKIRKLSREEFMDIKNRIKAIQDL